MLGFLTYSKSEERMRKPHIDFEFEMDVYYEVIRFNSYLHYLIYISLFEFDPPLLSFFYLFLYNCPENNLGVKDIICPIGD